jgi:protein-tyrosine phosphatase
MHPAILEVLRRLPGPLLLTSANRGGEPEATTPQEVLAAVGDDLALLIADGACRFGQPSTVVRVHGAERTVLREGVVSAAALDRLAGCLVVFICTGNTCRSPLAEGLFKQMLASHCRCRPEDLPHRGFRVQSAGLAAMSGGAAAPEAIDTAHELGVDLSHHTSRPLTPELAAQADFLFAMTESHLQLLIGQYPELGCRPRLLGSEGSDIPDPIGCAQPVYRECAQQIRHYLERLLPEVLEG